MKNLIIFVISLILIIAIGFTIYFFNNNNSISKENANNLEEQNTNIINEIKNKSISENIISNTKKNTNTETEIASFSTKLSGDSARKNNINITCNAINGTTLNNGDTFSFNNIVGNPTPDKGYQKADVFINMKTEKSYGGGNCQVSTTIYNAVLKCNELKVIARQPHQKKVGYIEEGKDAAVSYSSGLDFKFKNNTGKSIKIYASSTATSVDIRIVSI